MKKKDSVSVPTAVLIIFIILKLRGVITWPWIWVLAPMWIPLGIVAFLLLVYFVMNKIFR